MKNRDKCPGYSGYSGGCTNKADSPHVCPFKWELHDDETECKCCDECRAGCANDI